MAFQTPLICDRRIYDKKGKWKNPQQDEVSTIFYFIKEPLTLVPSYVNGKETFKATITITVFGAKPIAKEDKITLDTGKSYRVQQMVPNYMEQNVLIMDMLKARVGSMDLVLE